MDTRKFFLIVGSGIILVLIILMFTPESSSSKKRKSRSEQISNLLAGGSGTDSIDPSSFKRGQRIKSDSSVFDSGFDKAGINTNFTDEENTTSSDSGTIVPINPQTGKPYDEETMEQFDKLRLIFPENDLIPRKLTKEEKAKKDQEDAAYAQATTAYLNNSATKEQVLLYFNKQEKIIKDRLEIVEYLIDMQKEDGEYDKDGQFQRILDSAKEQLQNLETQKQEAFKKYGL